MVLLFDSFMFWAITIPSVNVFNPRFLYIVQHGQQHILYCPERSYINVAINPCRNVAKLLELAL